MSPVEVSELVTSARAGDAGAWASLVDRYGAVVWAAARSHRLSDADAADVFQTTWLRLLEHLDAVRDPAAVGGWLATTARNECLRVLRQQSRVIPIEDDRLPEDSVPGHLDAQLLADERDAALWQAFGKISARCQALLRMLAAEPPPSYDDVSCALAMPVGSIGPTRSRCLEKLRRAAAGTCISAPPQDSYP